MINNAHLIMHLFPEQRYIATILTLLLVANVLAQNSADSAKRNCLTLDFGLNQIKEENIHPKVHSGTITGLGYSHTLETKNVSEWGLNFRYSRLKTTYEDLSASANIQIAAHYHYLFKAISRQRYTYAVGPEVKLIYNIGLYPNWDESHLYWGNSFSLGVDNEFRYKLSENKSLIFNGYISVVSVLSRPEPDRQYKFDDLTFSGIVENFHSNMEAGTVDKAIALICRAEYKFGAGPRLAQALFYKVDYSRMEGSPGSAFRQCLHQLGFKLYF
jgi:hypothetical protein